MNPIAFGVLSAVLASLCFSVNDVVIKFLSGDYPLHQVVLVRSVVGLVVVLALFLPAAGGFGALRTRRLPIHLLRGGFVLASNMLYFTALSVMPLAEAMAVFFVAPLLITALSVPLLREYVGPRRWAAVAAGLLGVVVVMRPGLEAFQPAALLVLGSAATYALIGILARHLGKTESAVSMAFYVQMTFIVFSAAIGLFLGDGRLAAGDGGALDFVLRAWVWPTTLDWGLMVLAGVMNGLAGYLIGQAYRLCEAGLVAPFEYVALPMGVALGFLVFGEFPDLLGWIGIAMIVGAGLYMAWRELQKGKA
jgi:drug/metabolite transporter (DMT)-like permease